jgi:dephospho-CoA kinase
MKRIIKYANPKVIAVTGGIGSGQSTVCNRLQSLGCRIINVDKKAKRIIAKDHALKKELKSVFGHDIFFKDGSLNRKLLASLAFQSDIKTMQLNKLVHPRMVAEIVEEMETARFSQKYPLIVLDAALVYELSLEQMFDAVIVVYTHLDKRIKRVIERDGLNRKEILSRVRRQIPLDEKKQWADFVVDNNGTLDDLNFQINEIFEDLTSDIRTASRIRV